ncbi:hypothetical protein [Thalassotalea sp. ND16A]|uniref:hypothetical protein n=1 Tax=Thalassotalea sp. ND16A TaxID=1535422 RepID=UPI00051A7FC8|nr:hypothetical protein [Thalassotalea sp. ND16A]KGJ99160.1 hypothetical protein ND16A_3924 [Thalassotalea sp. ND16A]
MTLIKTIKQALLTMLLLTSSFISTQAVAVADQSAIYTITVWKIHPGKHVEFIKYMTEWEEVFKEINEPPMKWYRKISGDSYDFVSISPPFNYEAEKAMEAAGKKRGLPIGYNYTLKLNEFADSYTSTIVEGPQSMADLLAQIE